MTVRQLSKEDYDHFVRYLRQNARVDVFGTEYQLAVTAEGARYILRLQTSGKRKVYLLSAIRAERSGHGESF